MKFFVFWQSILIFIIILFIIKFFQERKKKLSPPQIKKTKFRITLYEHRQLEKIQNLPSRKKKKALLGIFNEEIVKELNKGEYELVLVHVNKMINDNERFK